MRVSGARRLASVGIEICKTQLLGRWGSGVILRYVREAPLCVVSADYRRRMATEDIESVLRRLEAGPQLQVLSSRLDDITAKALHDEAELRREIAVLREARGCGGLIRNESLKHHAKVVHRVAVQGFGVPCGLWRTRCGWRFAASEYTPVNELPKLWSDICEKCLPEERSEAKSRFVQACSVPVQE